ncbi:tropinone reductase [Salegentibacter salinarum]|uniref:Tropinone reductase n=1 Tax=Salegentibacter salinarum TaxID=447422 RepID=A0A2N0TU10_9FLAO|nr:SDR family oxidoreductase [Salegentibacter salinarum]PKD18230.1 tropinone reductase [Salegentibacter salinarum]SKB43112.1 Tropinone reductase 1 [Salegentibacter salinarum]
MWNLNNKYALVTGGTKGIGKATVLEYLRLGAEVLFTSRTQKDIDLVLEELKEYDKKFYGLVADVSVAEDRQKVHDFIENQWGRLDILVNNAGINIRKKANDYSEEEFRKVMEINLSAPFELSRKLHALLQQSGNAKIVNVASSAAMQDVGTGTPYAMSKAGLLQQTRSLAVEWAADGIRVNAVSPWFTVTPLTKGLLSESDRMDPIIKRTPLKRVAEAQEMASIVAFLAMDKSSYITGQNIVADGGMSINAI